MKILIVTLMLVSGAVKAAPNEQNIEGAAFLMLFCPVCMVPEAIREKEEKIAKEEHLEEASEETKSPQ